MCLKHEGLAKSNKIVILSILVLIKYFKIIFYPQILKLITIYHWMVKVEIVIANQMNKICLIQL